MTDDPQDPLDRLAKALRDTAPAPDPGRATTRWPGRWKNSTNSTKEMPPRRVSIRIAREKARGS